MRFTPLHEEPAELATVPIETVATIAAILSGPQTSSHDIVKRAYRLLDVALHGKKGLERGIGYGGGIQRHKESVAYTKEVLQNQASRPKELFRDGDDGNPLPVPFNKGLSKLMGRGTKKIFRELRFRRWLMDSDYTTFHWSEDWPPYFSAEAHKDIARWKKEGIPADVFELAWEDYNDWWIKSERKRKSLTQKAIRASKKTGAATKKETPTRKAV